jgi:hypothetical protein
MTRTYKMNNNETFVKDSGLKIRSGVRGGLYNKVAIRGLKVRSSVRGGLIIKMGRA